MTFNKKEYQRKYMPSYMRQERTCHTCNKTLKLFSYYRHMKTPRHLKKVEEQKEILQKVDTILQN